MPHVDPILATLQTPSRHATGLAMCRSFTSIQRRASAWAAPTPDAAELPLATELHRYRERVRAGEFRKTTSGVAPGMVQAKPTW